MGNEIKTKVTADSSQMVSETKKAETAVKSLTDTLKDSKDTIKEIGTVAGLAFASLSGAALLSVKAFRENEKATQELDLALRNAGLSSQSLIKNYREQAEALQDLTGIDDDAIVSAQALLQTYIGQAEITPEVTAALVDLSTQTGSLETAAEQLGKAYLGNVTAFQKQKIQIDENATAEERLAQAVDGVNQRIGGRAAALTKGLGVFTKLQTTLSSIAEEIGKRLAPAFTFAGEKLNNFFSAIEKNDKLLTFITTVGVIVGVIAGLVTALSGAALAFTTIGPIIAGLIPIIKALGITFGAASAATGIGALLIVIPLIITYFDELKAVAIGALVTLGTAFQSFGGILDALVSGNFKKVQEEFEKLKGSLEAGIKAGKIEFDKSQEAPAPGGDPNAEQTKAAAKSAEDLKRINDAKAAANQNAIDIQLLQAKKGSEELIKLKQEEGQILEQLQKESNPKIIAALKEREASVIAQQQAFSEMESEERRKTAEALLAQNAEFNALNEEQKAQFREKAIVDLQAQVQTENDIRRQAIAGVSAEQKEANNRYLADQQKYGAAYAEINKVIYSSQVKAAGAAAGELTQLQQSNNVVLKRIGQAAAVTDITIRTASSAMAVFDNFQKAIPFPPVSIPLGIAAAASVVAFGAEQIGKVLSAKEGGMVPGMNMGFDKTPALLQPGELVVPAQNFDQVVQAVASQQQAVDATQPTNTGPAASGGGGMIQIGFDGSEAEKVLTARRVEARALGTLRESNA